MHQHLDPQRRPLLQMWLGNFFEPFYSERAAMEEAIDDIKAMGFTTINLDSKAWADFFRRYRGEEASTYVSMQEHAMAYARSRGLDYTCLALYMCGDNLYPTIRDEAPIRGEDAIGVDGTTLNTYKYWSPRAHDAQISHLAGLLSLYAEGMHRTHDGRILIQTMFDPIPKPSFDEEGRQHYLAWLREHYGENLHLLNGRLATSCQRWEELTPQDYWLAPHLVETGRCAHPSDADILERAPRYWQWKDNQAYLGDMLEEYFRTMRAREGELPEPICATPVMHQWGYVSNPPARPDWDTASRALDLFRLGRIMDDMTVIAAPLNPENEADATVVSLEGAVLRGALRSTGMTAGLYLGQHINGNIYSHVAPGEAIATLVAAGARGIHMYGYSGLDDGGVLWKLSPHFKESIRAGNEWASRVIPELGESRDQDIALIFPSEMVFYEHLEHENAPAHRMDLLGWYRQFTDLGWNVDILDGRYTNAQQMGKYRAVVLPVNTWEGAWESILAQELDAYVRAGGTVIHGPGHAQIVSQWGIGEDVAEFDCITWGEVIVPGGWEYVTFRNNEPREEGARVLNGVRGDVTASGATRGCEKEVERAGESHLESSAREEMSACEDARAFEGGGGNDCAEEHSRAVASYVGSGAPAILETRIGEGMVVSCGFHYGYSYASQNVPVVPSGYGKSDMHPLPLVGYTPMEAVVGAREGGVVAPMKGVECARFGSSSVVVNHLPYAIPLRDVGECERVDMVPSPEGMVAAHGAVLIRRRR